MKSTIRAHGIKNSDLKNREYSDIGIHPFMLGGIRGGRTFNRHDQSGKGLRRNQVNDWDT